MPTWTTLVNQVSNWQPALRENLHSPRVTALRHIFLRPIVRVKIFFISHFLHNPKRVCMAKIKQREQDKDYRKDLYRICRECKDYFIVREITTFLKITVDNAILELCDSCNLPFNQWRGVYRCQWIIKDCFGMCTVLVKNPFFHHKLISEHM